MGVVAHAFKTASEKQKEVVLCEFPASLSYIERGKKCIYLSVCACARECVRVVVRRQFMGQFFPCTQWVRESNSCHHAWEAGAFIRRAIPSAQSGLFEL